MNLLFIEEVDLNAEQKKELKKIAHAIYEQVKKDPSVKQG